MGKSSRSRPPSQRSLKLISYSLTAQFLELFLERRDNLKKVADDTEIRNLEDGRVRVLVHSHDDFGRGHAGDMLNSAGDAEGQVEVGGNGLPSLAHLVLVADPAGVHGRPGCAHGRARAERRDLPEELKILRALH